MKHRRQAGQGMVEYALLLLLVAIGTLLALQLMGISVADVYCRVAGGFSPNACSATLCKDDFNNSSGSKVRNGPWNVSNGQMCIVGGGIVYDKCSMSNLAATDYSASLNDVALKTGNGYGIFFRATDTPAGTNGYAFQYDPGLKGFVVRKWVNGVEINPALAYKAAPANYDWYSQPHTLTIKVVGDTFTGYVDGQPVLSGKDSTYPSGGTGIRTWDSTELCLDQTAIDPIKP
jgi:Flp pilus assembly pilin Flp